MCTDGAMFTRLRRSYRAVCPSDLPPLHRRQRLLPPAALLPRQRSSTPSSVCPAARRVRQLPCQYHLYGSRIGKWLWFRLQPPLSLVGTWHQRWAVVSAKQGWEGGYVQTARKSEARSRWFIKVPSCLLGNYHTALDYNSFLGPALGTWEA